MNSINLTTIFIVVPQVRTKMREKGKLGKQKKT